MTRSQADEFVAKYSIVQQWVDAASGFSATLFRRNSDQSLYFAIRGTETFDTGDLYEDLTWILGNGYARNQILSLYNTLSRLHTQFGNAAPQRAIVDLFTSPPDTIPLQPFGSYRVVDTDPVGGTGLLANALGITVVGHSLGGHLAIAAARLFPGLVGQVRTYNAPGYNLNSYNARIDAYFAALGGLSAFPWHNMTHVKGIGPTAAATLYQLLGTAADIFIENSFFTPSDHRQISNTDALAMYDLFAQIDAQLELAKITGILKAAANNPTVSLESALDAVRRLFTGATDSTPNDRERYWERLAELRPTLPGGALAVSSLVDISASELLTQAQSEIGLHYRYALRALNPFVVIGPDALYARHNHSGELNPFVSASATPAGMTEQYLVDRTRMLAFLNAANTIDATGLATNAVGDQLLYRDRTRRISSGSNDGKPTELLVSPVGIPAFQGANTPLLDFGTDGADILQGRNNVDRLYGGIGADLLEGGRANDYLEGGAGTDLYQYNASTMASIPTNDGDDEIRDTDGRGLIRYTYKDGALAAPKSTVIGGLGIGASPTLWLSPDGKFRYDQQGSDLLVTINGDARGSIMIRGFDFAKAQIEGYLGIRLVDPIATPATAAQLTGDRTPIDTDAAQEGVQVGYDTWGNELTTDPSVQRDDAIYGHDDRGEHIQGFGGNDILFGDTAPLAQAGPRPAPVDSSGMGADDWIEGGAGRDSIDAGAGNDLIEAGSDGTLDGDAGGDIVAGGAGNDAIYGEGRTSLDDAIIQAELQSPTNLKGEFLYGGTGDDWLVGAPGNDILNGGEGRDIVVGGPGADTIDGDLPERATQVNWTETRQVVTQGGLVVDFLSTLAGVTTDGPVDVDAGAADVIYGGSGDDWIYARGGDDFVNGGSGDDKISGGAGADILVGGTGNDVLMGDKGNLTTGADGDDYLDGGEGDDTLWGSGGADILIGGDGLDTLLGGEGDDLLWGGRGNDILAGGPGKDTYIYHRGDGVDAVQDPDIGTGSQYLSSLALGPDITRDQVRFRLGSLVIDLGDGDAIHFSSFDPDDPHATPMLDAIQFADGEVMTYQDVLDQGFDLDGTEGNDVLSGTAVTDRIDGKGGDDRLIGKAGDDTLRGGAGRDEIDAGEGNDTVYAGDDADVAQGGAGDDVLFGEDGADRLTGGEGADSVNGGAGDDFVDAGSGDDTVDGGDGVDFVLAGDGDDEVGAGEGADVVKLGAGNDAAFGGGGNDSIEGDAGDDTIAGGGGDDVLTGGAGADIYVYSLGDGNDVISDAGEVDESVIDTLRFELNMADVALTRTENGDLLARMADGGTVRVSGMYNFNSSNAIERVEFADGSFLDAAALAALPQGVVLGTQGNDILVGGSLDDTIEGRGGHDWLNGGDQGADTLIGGAGHDRYRLGYGTESDTVVEAAGEASTVELDRGLTLSDLRASQSGDDLVLTVRGTGNELLVQGYFSSGQQVSVSEAGGVTATADQLLASSPPLDRESLKEDFRIAERARFFSNWIAGGLTPVDGSTLSRHDYPQFHAAFSQNFQTITTTQVPASGPSITTVRSLVLSNWNYTFINAVVHTTAHLGFETIASDDEAIFAPSSTIFQNTPGQELVQMVWQTTSSTSFQSQRSDIFPLMGGLIIHEYQDNWVSGTAVARTFPTSEGFVSPENMLFPRYRLIGHGDGHHRTTVREVLAGPGANQIIGAYIADGGAGDDVIFSSGLALGGDGNDEISGGGALYGEDGNDRLTCTSPAGGYLPRLMDGGSGNDVLKREFGDGEGMLMLPGSGNDLVVGGHGTDVVRIGAEDTGEKILWDAGTGSGGGEEGEGEPVFNNVFDRIELPGGATLDSLSLSWSMLDPLSELGQELGQPHRTLDLSWDEGTLVRFVRPKQSDGFGTGFDIVRLGYGTELSMAELLALAPPPPVEPIFGTPFDDGLSGDIEDDSIFGFEGNDFLQGGDGNDILDGGTGDDLLAGEAGSDSYIYRAGDGNDLIVGVGNSADDVDTLRLTGGISLDDVAVERDDFHLYIGVRETEERVRLDSWATDPDGRIDRVEFDDGTVWTASDLQARSVFIGEGLVLFGSDDAETLVGSEGADYIAGFGGDDVLFGLQADDTLDGGEGDDFMAGGPGDDLLVGSPGSDTYLLEPGGGSDQVDAPFFGGPANSDDVIQVAGGLTTDDILLTRGWDELAVGIAASADRIVLPFWFSDPSQRIAGLEFSDGTFWDADQIEARVTPAPATDGDDVIFATPGDDVIDALAGSDNIIAGEGDDVIDGGADGDYMQGDAGNDILRGGEGDDDVEDWEGTNLLDGGADNDYLYHEGNAFVIGGLGDDFIDGRGPGSVVAFNPGDGNDFLYAAHALTLSIGGGITAADLSLTQEDAYLRLSIASGESILFSREFEEDPQAWPEITLQLFASVHTFDFSAVIDEFYEALASDPELGTFGLDGVLQAHETRLSDTAALGGALAWRYANAGTLDGLGTDDIRGVLGGESFGLEPQPIMPGEGGNQPPVVANEIADRTATEDSEFSLLILPETFADPEEGALAYSVDELPAWLSFDAETGTFSGTPVQADVGTFEIRVTATDTGGLSAADDFIVTVENVNDAPIVANPLGERSFEAGSPFTFTVPVDTFADEDGDALLLSAGLFGGGTLPAWLSFDPATGAFSGNPVATQNGISRVVLTATDAAGAVSTDFGLVITAVAGSSVTGGKANDTLYGGSGNETLTAKGGDDALFGGAGDDLLKGGAGQDVLQGGEGADTLRGGKGQNLLDGGSGDDLIYGGQGSSMIVGGVGNDTIRTGQGSDVILFNRGDGSDTLIADREGNNTLSFGGGIRYSDLGLSRSGKDLIVSAGEDDRVVLKNWYGGKRSVMNLQIVLDDYDPDSSDPLHNRQVQTFDFLGLVGTFDQARKASPGLTSWDVTNALLQFHLSGADDLALGGDLAYWYAKNRGLGGISIAAAQQSIGAPNFGSDAQSLRPFIGLQEGFVKLS